jgi:hypothetical protein
MTTVEQAQEEYPADILESISGHDFEYYCRIVACESDKEYQAPYSGVKTRQNNGFETVDLECDLDLINRARNLYDDYF